MKCTRFIAMIYYKLIIKLMIIDLIYLFLKIWGYVMVFNATFNTISVICGGRFCYQRKGIMGKSLHHEPNYFLLQN
jgi:hypothetical protein